MKGAVQLRTDPRLFGKIILGVDLWRMQQEILTAAVGQHSRVAVKACHASGQSYAIAIAVLWWLTAHGDGIVVTTAPTWLQVEKVIWGETGLPWFLTLFGRDSLIVSLQTMLVYPDLACGTLEVLGKLQARERDDYRDAEPGKILHEMRHGELAHFKLIPHTPYYGTADATPLYLITLHAAWRATADQDLLKRNLATAEACLVWIDEFGDRDGDGFCAKVQRAEKPMTTSERSGPRFQRPRVAQLARARPSERTGRRSWLP